MKLEFCAIQNKCSIITFIVSLLLSPYLFGDPIQMSMVSKKRMGELGVREWYMRFDSPFLLFERLLTIILPESCQKLKRDN